MSLLARGVFVAGSLLGAIGWLYFRSRNFQSAPPKLGYALIYLLHVSMGGYFYQYIHQNGGDSLFYWQVPGFFESGFGSWLREYKYGSDFIQALNSPFVFLGISYLGGTFWYNLLSFVGIGLVYERVYGWMRAAGDAELLPVICALLVCMSPGLHFWTAGVSKEALLILGCGLAFYYSGDSDPKSLVLAFLGFFLVLQARVVTGIALGMPLIAILVANRKIPVGRRIVVLALMTILLVQGAAFLRLALLGEDRISLQSISEARGHQLEFLDGFEAGSKINLSAMNFGERVSAILFRPFPWEANNGHILVYSLENAFLAVLIAVGSYMYLKNRGGMPLAIPAFFVFSLMMVLIYSFTLNNYGIVYRMKSVFFPFLSLPFIWAFYGRFAGIGKCSIRI